MLKKILIAKLHACEFNEKSAVFLFSYLKRRKQNDNIDDILSAFQTLISGAPQLSHLLTTIENSEIYNSADNTISSISKEEEVLLTTLEKDFEKPVDWLRRNNMIVNPKNSIQ